ncbi:rab11 family-interacting protein 5 isoform X1 [Oncorhynchus mykiss]|uniref:RAB11 family interacting protein 5a (class I) n=1 Tax=Oncorhynchus mykiss TaxID=8022 RepID=A0A8C7NWU5_ONCMY|nr:rab11 family-interacting protein 5 isoform X1 [Oncorhynchus mykiss]
MSSLNIDYDEDQRWVPTHVQVTVLRGRGLRAKGKHGTSDVYTIIQVGKEKYSTCVLEKTTVPEWKEECSFELLPGVLEQVGDGGAYPPGSSDLVLTVMHRALMGLDVFLGQAVIHLDKVFQDRICMKNEWYKLNSKTGKKEKERGDIQVTVQFTKNNLTASMYDLSLGKDKPRSTFGKIKDRIKGKKRSSKDSDEDSASTVVGGYGPVSRMRNRLPSDGGGEEDYEDDEGGEGRRSKMRNFFLRGKLRKSSDTRSSTSLGSESSESSSRGGSLSPTAGISVVVSDLSNSPSNSSNFTADSPDHTAESSPKLASYTCEFTDESGEINIPVPQPVYINGSHVYNTTLDPCPGNPVVPLDPLALVKKNLPLSQSLQNLNQRREELPVLLPKGPAADGRRWSFDKAGKEEKVAIAAALEQAGQGMGEGAREESDRDRRSRNCLDESEQASNSDSGPGEKHKGWFGSKDNHNKPSPVVSPSSGSHLTPHTPGLTPLTPGLLSWGPSHLPVDPNSLGTQLHHTNPFSPSPPLMSPSNPFLSLLQCNPFYEELLADQALNLNSAQPHLPPCCSSFTSYISVAPQTWSTNTNPVPILPPTQDSPVTPDCTNTGMKEQRASLKLPPEEKSANTKDKEEEAVKTSQRPLPPLPKTETVPSANSPLCEEDMSYAKAETASFYSATGPDNIAALDLMGEFSDDRCWATCDDVIRSDTIDRATSHLGATCVVKEKTTSPEARIDWPIGMDLESYNSAELSNALLHSVRSQAHSPLKTVQSTTGTSSGEKVNEDIEDYRSEDQYSEHPHVESVVVQHSLSEEHPLQRSLSEGTRRNSVEDLTLSFGSDPGVVTLGSLSFVQQHDTSDLLAASSFSAPSSLTAERNTSSSPALSSLPAPPPATVRSSVSTVSAATLFSTAQPVIGASHAGLPQETHPPANQQISPHPVKPLTPEEKRRAELSEGRSVLDKLKSSIHPGRSSQPTEQQPEKKKSLTEGAGPYYHLTHSELVALLLQREADLHRQRVEFDHQGALLAKREAELKKMKPQVRDLEDYIDTLLVRIMEQTPTILQVGTKLK